MLINICLVGKETQGAAKNAIFRRDMRMPNKEQQFSLGENPLTHTRWFIILFR